MTNYLNSELRLARRITAFGSGVLHALAALSLLGEALHCAIVLSAELPGTWGDPLFEVLLVISQLAAIGAIVLAARFLRHFCVDPSPFSHHHHIPRHLSILNSKYGRVIGTIA